MQPNQTPSTLRSKSRNLPRQPGVYIMKSANGAIIYVGKATSLRARVSSYFSGSLPDRKTELLVRAIDDFEYIVTDSEIEALILENTLIKKHQPKYNVRLRDDKRYPYIAVTLSEEYPRLVFTRKLQDRRSRYFGPYTDAKAARSIVETMNRLFKLRRCARSLPLRPGERPCLNFQMKRCSGVCAGTLSRDDYRAVIDVVIRFMEGDHAPVIEQLQEQMRAYSSRFEYEKASYLRDVIFDIQRFTDTQKVVTSIGHDRDYIDIGAGGDGDEAVAIVFEFRNGVLIGRKIHVFDNALQAPSRDILRTLIVDCYAHDDTAQLRTSATMPSRIVVAERIPESALLERHLSGIAKKSITISTPRTADDAGIMNMIAKNIDVIIAERAAHRVQSDTTARLIELRDALQLARAPEIIECFDISNLQGTHAVASMVQFKNGAPNTRGYRRYKIRGYDGANDPGMIHEAVARRLQYLMNESIPPPDVLVVDGGATQVARAREAADALGCAVTIIGLAKRHEEIHFPDDRRPLRLPPRSHARKLLQAIRDEAHRFAHDYHTKLRGKAMTASSLDEIPGIASGTKRLLLSHFADVEAIRRASIDELCAVPGIGKKIAEKIHRHLHAETKGTV
ncbi:MAG TPA: excinuclease ABC subunit UvrC [Spirochaetota bacterium]|nr:excinuclease ABC subunit UvrC [Spirochaetota bacterium]HNT10641.1 excinuclease ABC subunit UvrC [Spirochaetota bacterium]